MSTKDTSSEGTEKKPLRCASRQAHLDFTVAKDASNLEANQATANFPMDFTALTMEIKMTVAAVVEEKMSIICNKLDIIQNTLECNSQRLTQAETRISTAENISDLFETRLRDTEEKLNVLTNRIDEQERRSRIFGVKEGVEGKDAVSYFETWLPKRLHKETKKGKIRLDRSHRSIGQPKPGVPRAVITKLHYPLDKIKVLTLSGKQRLLFEGATIYIVPQSVLQQRRKFSPVCQKLIAKGTRFRMQYPATSVFLSRRDRFRDVNLSPRVILRKPFQISEHPYEDSQGMKTEKAKIKAPLSATEVQSPIRAPEKRFSVPITSMDDYKRKMEAKARSTEDEASSSLDVHRANHIPRSPYPTSEKMYPTRALVNNIPAPQKVDHLKKQDAKKKTAGTKISSGKSHRGVSWYLWRLVLLVLLSSATLLAYRILPVLHNKAGGGGQRPREVMPEKFSDRLSLLQSRFPSQQDELWKRTKIHLENHLKKDNPPAPVSLILVAGRIAEKTLQCLAQSLASTYSSVRHGSFLLIDGATKAGQDSDGVKLDIDKQLQAAFEGDKPAAIIHHFEELPPDSTIIFYRYCDHETAAYKQAFLLFTVLLPQDEIRSNLSLKEVEELVYHHLEEKFVKSTSKASFNEMDIDKFGGLWSRISHVVLPVVPELKLQECQ